MPAALKELPLPSEIVAEGRSAIALRWTLSRALTLAMLVFLHEGDVTGDARYYASSLHALFSGGSLGSLLQEYPIPVLGLLLPQFAASLGNQQAFVFLFALSMLAVDAAFTALLWRGDGRHRGDSTNLWLWFVPAIGPLAYFRFDLVPAVLAGGAVLAAIRRPALAGALTAMGAALKLWPALMLPTFLIRKADRVRVLVGFVMTGLLLGALSVVVGGWNRAISPLHWQSSRGLQIESVSATPLMLARVFDTSRWHVALSEYKAFEIFGPGVHAFERLSTALTVAGGVLLVAMWWRAIRHPAATAETLGWLFLATALIVTVTNKTLSPQYLLWLGGPVAALAVRAPANPAVRQFGRILLVAALATQLEYPIGYNAIVQAHHTMPLWITVLALRNVLLVVLTVLAVRRFWQLTAQAVPEPQPVTVAAAGTQ